MRRYVRSRAACGKHRDPGVYLSTDLHRCVQLILKVNATHTIGYLFSERVFLLVENHLLSGKLLKNTQINEAKKKIHRRAGIQLSAGS